MNPWWRTAPLVAASWGVLVFLMFSGIRACDEAHKKEVRDYMDIGETKGRWEVERECSQKVAALNGRISSLETGLALCEAAK